MLDLKTPNIIREPYPMQARSCSLFRALNHRCDVCSWHIASFRCVAKLVAYWANNGQRVAQGLNRYAAIDP